MRRVWQSRLSTVVIMLGLLAGAARAQSGGGGSNSGGEALYPELPNFHEVNRQFYRGAQPRENGVQKLAALGIRTIINLRGDDEQTRAEQKAAEAAGLRYFSIPLPDLSRPPGERVERVMALINTAENQPVFVHCNHGKDRTGVIAAVYRITHDGWTAERAKAEARRYGMSWVQVGMKDYISDYYRDWIKLHPASPSRTRLTPPLPLLLLPVRASI
jgi:tyrosine-protein phosphatase SIW14